MPSPSRFAGLWFLFVALMVAPDDAGAADRGAPAAVGAVQINGVPVPGAQSSVDVKIDITEFRQAGDPQVILVAGPKHYAVAISINGPIPLLDAELPVQAGGNRFTITSEDGREFVRCLLAGLKSASVRRGLIYSMQCENLLVPPP